MRGGWMGLAEGDFGIEGCGMKGGRGLRIEVIGVGMRVEVGPDLPQSRS